MAELTEARAVLDRFLAAPAQLVGIEQATHLLVTCLRLSGKIHTFSNGGSRCDAQHFAEELTGRYRQNRPALTAIAISGCAQKTENIAR